MAILQAVGKLLSRGPTLTILSYHRVLGERDTLTPDYPTQREFHDQLRSASQVLKFVTLQEGVQRVLEERDGGHYGVVTLDDGYRDNHDHALPVLRRLDIPATVFVATSYLNGTPFFVDRIVEACRRTEQTTFDGLALGLPRLDLSSLQARSNASNLLQVIVKYRNPDERDRLAQEIGGRLGVTELPRLMMTPEEIRCMHDARVEIAAHGHRHPMFSVMEDAELRSDLETNIAAIRNIVGVAPTSFAYPNGRLGSDFLLSQEGLLAACGLKIAVTTQHGIVRPGAHPYRLPRFSPWDKRVWSFRLRLLAVQRP